MGKFLVKLGMIIQMYWSKLMCAWNWLMSKLMVEVSSCPYKVCECHKNNEAK